MATEEIPEYTPRVVRNPAGTYCAEVWYKGEWKRVKRYCERGSYDATYKFQRFAKINAKRYAKQLKRNDRLESQAGEVWRG